MKLTFTHYTDPKGKKVAMTIARDDKVHVVKQHEAWKLHEELGLKRLTPHYSRTGGKRHD